MNDLQKIVLGVTASIGILYAIAGLTTVEPGEYTIQIKQFGENRGIQAQGLDTGTHWVDPILYDVETYDTKFKQYTIEGLRSSTKDGQPIALDISFEIGLIDEQVKNIHETIGHDYFDQIILPAARSAIRASTSSADSDYIYTGAGRAEVQSKINENLAGLEARGIRLTTNLRDVWFVNEDFVNKLEEKAKAAQQVEIENRKAEAAIHTAEKVANIARGEKDKRVLAAEALREELRLQGEGSRLQKEEEAKGILAVKQAEAEGQRLLVSAYGSMGAEAVVGIAWAENLGPNVKVYGIPTGSPGTTSLIDMNSMLKGAFAPGK